MSTPKALSTTPGRPRGPREPANSTADGPPTALSATTISPAASASSQTDDTATPGTPTGLQSDHTATNRRHSSRRSMLILDDLALHLLNLSAARDPNDTSLSSLLDLAEQFYINRNQWSVPGAKRREATAQGLTKIVHTCTSVCDRKNTKEVRELLWDDPPYASAEQVNCADSIYSIGVGGKGLKIDFTVMKHTVPILKGILETYATGRSTGMTLDAHANWPGHYSASRTAFQDGFEVHQQVYKLGSSQLLAVHTAREVIDPRGTTSMEDTITMDVSLLRLVLCKGTEKYALATTKDTGALTLLHDIHTLPWLSDVVE
ncbi:hypothetical protein M231_06485 [Tremella mesenterica]|uniref:Uncharacterized protein n=1 Tax=Tremella mesenterica TaxID=5217 RepID=A0A4Q1BF42_TREME|nr:hypothetical protein M231_06485 [Tremella mesenterica]